MVATAELLQHFVRDGDNALAIGSIEVAGGAMNKVPGSTTTMLRIAADDEKAFARTHLLLQEAAAVYNARYSQPDTAFDPFPFSLEIIDKPAAGPFFQSPEMRARQRTAFEAILAVNKVAGERADRGVVGTVGAYEMDDAGKISLKVDIRGSELSSRDQAVEAIRRRTFARALASVAFGEPLAGSGEPVSLDPVLVAKATTVIKDFEIGSSLPPFW